MKRAIALFFAILAIVAVATAQMTINVGDGGLKFNPATGSVPAGSMIMFKWVSANQHSVVRTDDGTTCTPSTVNVYKGGPAAQMGFTSNFTVPNNVDKLWFICGVPGHCEAGMKLVLTVTGGSGGSTNSSSGSGSPTSTSAGSSPTTGSGSGYGSSASTLGATFGTLFTALVASLLL
ncbi:6594_t:CDS:2 [Paraglomus occultum]|uniref:6594_t:CDS:1 n=1 Tax=Paraglomus occultum TaxID=144539 RepID=A0A9N9B913_9GLOM|nr:6594_t:CDS:2 [Paraglomus occultum]